MRPGRDASGVGTVRRAGGEGGGREERAADGTVVESEEFVQTMKDLTAILQHHFEDNTELARRCRCHPWLATLPHRPRYHRVSELEHGEALISEMLPGFPSDGLAASALPPLPPAGP